MNWLLPILCVTMVMGCADRQAPLPPRPVPDFDWRVYNGPAHHTPYVRVDEVELDVVDWKRATHEQRARRAVKDNRVRTP